MQSLSIQLSIGLILVLVAAASASADSSPAPYSPEEWKQVFDRITSTSTPRRPAEGQPMTVDEVREGLERLLVQVPEQFRGEEERIRGYLDLSQTSEDRCREVDLFVPYKYSNPFVPVFDNLGPYKRHYKEIQSKFCAQMFIKRLESRNISVEDETNVKELHSAINAHAHEYEPIVKGSAAFMRQKMAKKEISQVKSPFSKEEVFNKNYDELIVEPCRRVTKPIWDLIQYSNSLRSNRHFVGGLGDKLEFLEAIRDCGSILGHLSAFREMTYSELRG